MHLTALLVEVLDIAVWASGIAEVDFVGGWVAEALIH